MVKVSLAIAMLAAQSYSVNGHLLFKTKARSFCFEPAVLEIPR